ncbi:MAG TPA: outer membrane beta-barrel protein [Candidatus Polarisedimenticolia bacterium]|nr:outer membrane beta-barrel protein [Candidatus Polarisedimenticolia bacterium]
MNPSHGKTRRPGGWGFAGRPSAPRRVSAPALLLLAGVLAGFAAPPAARAATPPPDPDLSTENTRLLGPFHLRPFLALKDAGYDDNVRFDAQKRASDTTATLGAGLEALLLAGARGGLRLSQELDYVGFARNEDLNHWNGFARARGVYLARRLDLSLEDQYASVRERPGSEIDQRLRRTDNTITAALRTVGSGRLGVRAALRRQAIDYSAGDPLSDLAAQRLNRNEDRLSVAGELKVRPKTILVLEGTVANVTFDDPSEGRDAHERSILPGLRFDPSASIQGEIRIGRTSLRAPDRPGSDYSGTIGDGRLSARLGQRARLKALFARELVFSILADNLYYVGTSWSAAYEQFFSRRLSGEIGYGRGLNHYPVAVLIGGLPGIRDDRLTTRQISVRYRVNPEMSISANAYHLTRDSTDDALDRARNAYMIGTNYNF